ncbi:C-type lectin domain family 4 member F isoform X1 [Artibeus jamaicensis]|uniref:C-type lectin domain family 4 member F isoform X1 n=1 Tax=Artibeus jamaicensis TaxID=9417 RepID=UPI00235AFBA0|nr:C-type lectin domain family 4 member F isoform X1 [Artibeus jamaicensis]
MKEAEMKDNKVHFCTDNQTVALYNQGLDSSAVAPAASKKRRLVQATVAFLVMTIITSLMALFFVVLQKPRPVLASSAHYQEFPRDNTTEQAPGEPDDPHHTGRVAELQETIQMFKDHVENSSAWSVDIQMLMCRVDNVSSQIQVLSGHLRNTSADVQSVKGALEDASILSFQTQMLNSSLEAASAEIQRQKRDLEKANALNSQTQRFLKTGLENTSSELHMLSRGLENTNTEIQALKAGLKMANTQAQLANSGLKNANAQILILRGNLDSVNDLRAQNQVLRNSLKGTNAEIQKLKGSLQTANDLNSQTQTLVQGSLDNTSAEIQLLRGHLERAGNEIHQLKRDLETATAQAQMANGRLEQTNAQIQGLKTELENTSALNANVEVLNNHLKNDSREIQILKQEMKDAAALKSKTQMLERKLQEANAEIQRLKHDVDNTKTLATKAQEVQSSLETLRSAFASQEQRQNEVLQLITQGWKMYGRNLYYFSSDKKTWQEAEQYCVSQGAHLASVTSAEEQAYLIQFTSTSYHWIGLNDRNSEGTWRWTDGSTFSSSGSRQFWSKNQPDNWHNNGGDEDCVQIQQKWNDVSCNARYPWVCKKPFSQGVA